MTIRLRVLIVSSALLIGAGTSAADEDKAGKGYGAGGVRADHASEQGLQKGNAWAGSKDMKEKQKKEKKQKKGKKSKD